jgi:single-stranded-DNA-specific exonuclease
MAAGLTVRRDRLDRFRDRFGAVALRQLDPVTLGPEQRVDLELSLADVTADLERLCRHLEPCGMGNPSPVFGVREVHFAGRQVVGQGHLKGFLRGGDCSLETIGFQWADRVPWLGDEPVDAAVKLESNEYLGRATLQARLVALSPCRADPGDGRRETGEAETPLEALPTVSRNSD